ncbi:hypothetical protein TNCV_3751021 [Trichonephila clavipes]|uniref:Uncharacterized protein n=1 Tax=Trichonephila clavipes TaxID=2585209 RepID=A0A8X6R7E3_TRICX|nr:hypothetical protein TNCV_3751021 [Trichonephila clavipes]
MDGSLRTRDDAFGNEENTENTSRIVDFPTVSWEEFVTVDDDNVCTAPIMADRVNSKHKKYHDSDDENEKNNAAPVPTTSEMMNIMKSGHSYLDTHSTIIKWMKSNNLLTICC